MNDLTSVNSDGKLQAFRLGGCLRGSHVFGQVARWVYSRGKRRHGNGSKKAQIFVRLAKKELQGVLRQV